MARDVRIIDSPGYSGGGFIRPDVEVMEFNGRGPYRRRWTGGEPLVLILILGLIAMWVYRNSGGEIFGRQILTPSQTTPSPVEIGTAPVVPPVTPIEEYPTATDERRPAVTVEQQSEIMGYSRVVAESLNLRDRPGFERRVIAVLPRYGEVAILRQSHVTPNGDVWVEILAGTDDGWLKGWVMGQYLESCNCPAP